MKNLVPICQPGGGEREEEEIGRFGGRKKKREKKRGEKGEVEEEKGNREIRNWVNDAKRRRERERERERGLRTPTSVARLLEGRDAKCPPPKCQNNARFCDNVKPT